MLTVGSTVMLMQLNLLPLLLPPTPFGYCTLEVQQHSGVIGFLLIKSSISNGVDRLHHTLYFVFIFYYPTWSSQKENIWRVIKVFGDFFANWQESLFPFFFFFYSSWCSEAGNRNCCNPSTSRHLIHIFPHDLVIPDIWPERVCLIFLSLLLPH